MILSRPVDQGNDRVAAVEIEPAWNSGISLDIQNMLIVRTGPPLCQVWES
jgi:hypothetical protein